MILDSKFASGLLIDTISVSYAINSIGELKFDEHGGIVPVVQCMADDHFRCYIRPTWVSYVPTLSVAANRMHQKRFSRVSLVNKFVFKKWKFFIFKFKNLLEDFDLRWLPPTVYRASD
jgi:hypothetical protein